MALTRNRNGRDGAVLRAPPPELGILYPSDDDEPIANTEPQYHAITDAVFALKMHLQQLGRTGTIRKMCLVCRFRQPDLSASRCVAVLRSGGPE